VRRTASEGRDPGGSSPFFLYTRPVKRDSPDPDPADERRGSPRIRPSRSARLLDVSALGLAVETEADVTKGQIYDLILGLDDHRMPISARAVHVRKEGKLIRASFAFDRVLESDRQLLRQTLVREVVDRMTVLLR
jgi:PilZ domain-containing protein